MNSASNIEPSKEALWLLTAMQLDRIGAVAGRRLAEWMLHSHKGSPADKQYFESIAERVETDALARGNAQRVVEKCIEHSIKIIAFVDAQYPKRLREIRDAPPIVYVKGETSALSMPGCAVVGTRQASDVGLKLAHRIAASLAKRCLSTISGLALGIDAAAHQGAIDESGVTVCILAHGLDTVAPSSNRKLAQKILDLGGAWLSEHEPGFPPRPAEFVRRNRLQSGMALCSIIVESGAVGGSIHQARFTKEQGRLVLAVLPDLQSCPHARFNSEGGEFLVRTEGATPLRTAEELGSHLERLLHVLASANDEATKAPEAAKPETKKFDPQLKLL